MRRSPVMPAACLGLLAAVCGLPAPPPVRAEALVIAVSPSLLVPLKVLGRTFEAAHPDVRVHLHVDNALDLRRTIAAVHNDGRHDVEAGAVHLVAPGNDELLDRLEQRYYILPGTRRVYAVTRLVLVVPESLVDAPESLEQVARTPNMRLAVSDPQNTNLGWQTRRVLQALGVLPALEGRIDVAADAEAVLDHLLRGQADVGVLFSSDAAREGERVRISGVVRHPAVAPVSHSVAMDRFCPNRRLCLEFLEFTQSSDAQAAIRQLGYELK